MKTVSISTYSMPYDVARRVNTHEGYSQCDKLEFRITSDNVVRRRTKFECTFSRDIGIEFISHIRKYQCISLKTVETVM
jgi:hypothetical protein